MQVTTATTTFETFKTLLWTKLDAVDFAAGPVNVNLAVAPINTDNIEVGITCNMPLQNWPTVRSGAPGVNWAVLQINNEWNIQLSWMGPALPPGGLKSVVVHVKEF